MSRDNAEIGDAGEMELGDGRLFKMEVDYTSQVDELLPKADLLLKEEKIGAALDALYVLEKQTRLGADMKSNARILQAMVRICFEAKEWTLLNETIITLSKKRSIIKQAVGKMIRDCCAFVEKMPDDETELKLIDTLRTVTAGKIFVEVERARLTCRLVKRLEAENKLDEACDMLLQLQVETYGSMQMKEKVECLLEQMRLCVLRKDYVRASIISNKISTHFFDTDNNEVQQLKLVFYKLMIEIGQQEDKYLDICRYYWAVYDTPNIKNDSLKSAENLKNMVLYVLLAVHSNDQRDLLHRIKALRQLEKIADYRKLVDLFTRDELISWHGDIQSHFESVLRAGTVFDSSEKGHNRWQHMNDRVAQHNIRIIAKYYTRIGFDRMAQLLDFPVDTMEQLLCKLIVTGDLGDARIDRMARTVDFRPRKAVTERLNDWTHSVNRLTDILNKVSHQIAKEEMVHRHLHAH